MMIKKSKAKKAKKITQKETNIQKLEKIIQVKKTIAEILQSMPIGETIKLFGYYSGDQYDVVRDTAETYVMIQYYDLKDKLFTNLSEVREQIRSMIGESYKDWNISVIQTKCSLIKPKLFLNEVIDGLHRSSKEFTVIMKSKSKLISIKRKR